MSLDHVQRVQTYLPRVEASSPSSTNAGTTPGSFANAPRIFAGRSGALTYSSPDTPNMPVPSDRTAWDFMPDNWTRRPGFDNDYERAEAWQPPSDFQAITQLEFARLGVVTPEMHRVAEREQHLTVEQIRDEVAAGRIDRKSVV